MASKMGKNGGRRPNTGGARPGAGRKLPPSAIEFRDYWRGVFNRKNVRAYLWTQAKRLLEKENDPSLMGKLLDKTYASPNELSIDGSIVAGMTYRCVDEDGKDAAPGGGD